MKELFRTAGILRSFRWMRRETYFHGVRLYQLRAQTGSGGGQVYFYDGSANTVEEMAFLSSEKSPEILKAQIDRLAYINGKYELYLFLNDQICCVHLDSRTAEITAEGLSTDGCSVSESNRMIAWQSGERYASESLILMNLSTGEQTEIAAAEKEIISFLSGLWERTLCMGSPGRPICSGMKQAP